MLGMPVVGVHQDPLHKTNNRHRVRRVLDQVTLDLYENGDGLDKKWTAPSRPWKSIWQNVVEHVKNLNGGLRLFICHIRLALTSTPISNFQFLNNSLTREHSDTTNTVLYRICRLA